MNLSRGAERLLLLLNWYKQTFPEICPSLTKLATQLKRNPRTIKRWLAELRSAGAVSMDYHGHAGAVFRVPDVPDVPVRVPDHVPDVPVHLCINSFSSTVGSKLAEPETYDWPEEWIVHAAGGRERNPEWLRLQGVMREAKGRILGARNPAAYERAILRAEFPHLRRKPVARAVGA